MTSRRDFLLSPLLAVPPLLAQENQDPRFGVEVKVVAAPVTVSDNKGHMVNGLESKDFTLYDNNVVQEI